MESLIGNIYSYYIKEVDKYTAYQLVGSDIKNDSKQFVALNYLKDNLVTEAELSQLKVLKKDHFNWKGEHDVFEAQGTIPDEYSLVANIPVIEKIELQEPYFPNYTWEPYRHIIALYKWENYPSSYKERYKAATTNDIMIGGTMCKENHTRISAATIKNVESGAELDKLPRLTEIYISKECAWLIEYLEDRPWISRLVWSSHNQSELDFRNTELEFCSVDVTNLKRLYLNESLKELSLSGEISSELEIYLHNNSVDILYLESVFPKKQGLNVRSLWLQGVREVILLRC